MIDEQDPNQQPRTGTEPQPDPSPNPPQSTGHDDDQAGQAGQGEESLPLLESAAQEPAGPTGAEVPEPKYAHEAGSPSDLPPPSDQTPSADASITPGAPSPADRSDDLFIQPASTADAPNQIDPADFIEPPDFNFDELINGSAADDNTTARALLESLKHRTFERRSFNGFDNKPDGERLPFQATLDKADLLLINAFVLATYPDLKRRPCLVRLVIFHRHLGVQANDFTAVLQHRIELTACTGVPEGHRTAFYIAASDLDQSVQAADAAATLEWTSGDALIFSSGSFTRDIALRPVQQFTKLGTLRPEVLAPEAVHAFPAGAVTDFLKYAAPLLDGYKKFALQHGIIEAGNGSICAGAPGALAVITTPAINDFVYSIRGQHAEALSNVLAAMHEPIEAFNDGRHFILWDGATAWGADVSNVKLGDAQAKWEAVDWSQEILIPRSQFAFALRHIQKLSGADTFELLIRGSGKMHLTLSASTAENRRARRTLEGYSKSTLLPTRMQLPLWPMIAAIAENKAIEAKKSSSVAIRLGAPGLMIDDSGDKNSLRHYVRRSDSGAAK